VRVTPLQLVGALRRKRSDLVASAPTEERQNNDISSGQKKDDDKREEKSITVQEYFLRRPLEVGDMLSTPSNLNVM